MHRDKLLITALTAVSHRKGNQLPIYCHRMRRDRRVKNKQAMELKIRPVWDGMLLRQDVRGVHLKKISGFRRSGLVIMQPPLCFMQQANPGETRRLKNTVHVRRSRKTYECTAHRAYLSAALVNSETQRLFLNKNIDWTFCTIFETMPGESISRKGWKRPLLYIKFSLLKRLFYFDQKELFIQAFF